MGGCGDRCRSFGLAICNPSKGTFCGRTCKSWALILIYYAIYYVCLAGFFMGMLSVLMYGLLKNDVPSLTGMQSLLKLEPGMGYLPQLDPDNPLLQVSTFRSPTRDAYVNAIDAILKNYTGVGKVCSNTSFPTLKDACKFDLTELGPCADPSSSISRGHLCVYAKLNKIYGWLPNITNNEITFQCGAANPHDAGQIGTPQYYPHSIGNASLGSFDTKFFPYLNQPTYRSPLVGILLNGISMNTVVMFQCKFVNIQNAEEFRFDVSVDDVEPI